MEPNQETEKLLVTRATNRRDALKRLGIGVIGVAGLNALAAPSAFAKKKSDNQKDNKNDIAILQFALNLEYLEAEYYTYATKGHGIEQEGVEITGRQGPPGMTSVKMNPQVPFTDDDVEAYANEIAQDERKHVTFLRAAIESLGGKPVAKPAIDLNSSWNAFAQAAMLPGGTFDPFADDKSFLLGSFVFEDVGVTAYHGAASLINRGAVLNAAAGILAVEAYHAGIIRERLYAYHDSTVTSNAQKISDARDMLDNAVDDDQGIVDGTDANLVPTDNRGLAYARTSREVLNIVYFAQNAKAGGFFPLGINAG